MILFLMVVAAVVLFVRHRAHKARVLGGLTGERPVFSVQPPARRLSGRKGERL